MYSEYVMLDHISGEICFLPTNAKTDQTELEMTTEFKARNVAEIVQKNFANKILSNKVVAKNLIDDNSAALLDNLFNLIFAYVSKIQDVFQSYFLSSFFRQKTKRIQRRQFIILSRSQ